MQFQSQNSSGFTLAELLVFIVIISLAAMLALPSALTHRATENERSAIVYLKMVAGAQQHWLEETDSYASLRQLATTVPLPAEGDWSNVSVLRSPFLSFSPAMVISDDGTGHRGGYRFQLGLDSSGNVSGCWAWPNLIRYSGESSYWVDFASEDLFESKQEYSFEDTPEGRAPQPETLSLLKGE